MSQSWINSLSDRLKLPLPGLDAQYEMAHVNREKIRPQDLNPSDYRKSAVLLLLCKKHDSFIIPLTERHDYNGWHSNQISLPGGKFEDSDGTLEQTALRECAEEIGISEGIKTIGQLTPVFIPVSKFMVLPFVGVLTTDEIKYGLNVNEVKSILELPLHDLKDPRIVKVTAVEPTAGIKFKTPYFDVQGKVVWGATAMILNEFKSVLPDLNF